MIRIIGLDITFWGGSLQDKSSQNDIYLSCDYHEGKLYPPHLVVAELSKMKPGYKLSLDKATRDADAVKTTSVLKSILGDNIPAILCVDAPLEGNRGKRHRKPVKNSVYLRQCEKDLISDSARSKFRPFLQPGNPLFPRITAFVRKVKDLGFDFKPLNIEKNKRLMIEVFPSASIWVLGKAGFYSYLGDEVTANKVVRRYKKDKHKDKQMIKDTLSGFIRFFEKLNIDLEQWLNCFTDDIYKNNIKGKNFDDSMDAAIACLTGISFLLGKYKVYGKPKNNKGSIVVLWV